MHRGRGGKGEGGLPFLPLCGRDDAWQVTGRSSLGCVRVPLILASRPNAYSGSPLDRAAQRRDDAAWIEAAMASDAAVFAPVWRARNLMRGVAEGAPEAVFLSGAAAAALRLRGWPDGGI